jgi:hypothetical protein
MNPDSTRIDEILGIAISLDLFGNLRLLGYHTLELSTYVQEEALAMKDKVEAKGLDCVIDNRVEIGVTVEDSWIVYDVWSKIKD